MAFRQEQQGAVGGRHIIQEHRDIHRPRRRHAVIAVPGAKILMPLPNLAVEGGFGVDLVLVHIEFTVENLLDRLD